MGARRSKALDCVEMKRRAQERIYAETQDLSREQLAAYFRDRGESGPFADLWKRSQPKPRSATRGRRRRWSFSPRRVPRARSHHANGPQAGGARPPLPDPRPPIPERLPADNWELPSAGYRLPSAGLLPFFLQKGLALAVTWRQEMTHVKTRCRGPRRSRFIVH